MDEVRQTAIKTSLLMGLFPSAVLMGDHSMLPEFMIEVADDSRKVFKRGIFIAVVGYETDGHLYLKNALDNGAALLVVDENHIREHPEVIEPAGNAPLLLVENTRRAASILAGEFYRHPSRECAVHGVTGTKGKTTTVHILADILNRAGHRCAVMGTLGVEFNGEKRKSDLTTPGPIEFQKRMRFLADLGATDIACEVSAHAGALSRTASVFLAMFGSRLK